MSQEKHTPVWDELVQQGFEDLIGQIGMEAYERMIYRPLEQEFDKLIATGEVGAKAADLTIHVGSAAAAVACRIGFRLALIMRQGDPGPYEQWLVAAIKAAGLEGYQPNIKLDLPKP